MATASAIPMDSIAMAESKAKLKAGTASKLTKLAYKQLITRADQLLTIKNPTVVDKHMIPPSGNKHDYLSLSRYWWPNPDTPDGLPWIRKDGETNPETQTDAVDRRRFGLMAEGVWNLSLAYYYTDNIQYAEKAVSMIETWYLNEDTYMRPNLNFAQGVPGRTPGKASGVLDGRLTPMYIPDAIALLTSSGLWTADHEQKFKDWLKEYLNWLLNSELGVAERKQPNNHGTWYKYQIVAIANYLGKRSLVETYLDLTLKSLDDQMTADGGQMHELKRTRSFFYSCYNLEALFKIAVEGDKIGVNIRNHVTDKKRSCELAISFLTPVLQGEKWNYKSINGVDITLLAPILYQMRSTPSYDQYEAMLPKIIEVLTARGFTSNSDKRMLQELWLVNGFDQLPNNQ